MRVAEATWCTRCIGAELIVSRIQTRQHLAGLHALAQFHLALDDLATDAKAQARLHSRAHITGKFLRRLDLPLAHGQQLAGGVTHNIGQR